MQRNIDEECTDSDYAQFNVIFENAIEDNKNDAQRVEEKVEESEMDPVDEFRQEASERCDPTQSLSSLRVLNKYWIEAGENRGLGNK